MTGSKTINLQYIKKLQLKCCIYLQYSTYTFKPNTDTHNELL